MTADGLIRIEADGDGLSLDRGYQNQLWRRMVLVMVVPLMLVQLAVYEWVQAVFGNGSAPVGLTLMAGLAAVYAAVRVRPLERRLAAGVASRGVAGLWRLEEVLLGMRKDGAVVWRDYPVGEEDVVPVLVVWHGGMLAVWVDGSRADAEKSADVAHRLVGEREVLTADGFEVFGNPLGRAVAGAAEVRRLLQGGRNPDCYVQPVLVMPGATVVERLERSAVTVVDESGLKRLFESAGQAYDAEAVGLMEARLERRRQLRG